ncbi:MAG TPA: hypothetical protein VMF65_22885 [Acidimicrobiales bacterium]|nr:hypothetical protein [Acidimicrobiales bacterium]
MSSSPLTSAAELAGREGARVQLQGTYGVQDLHGYAIKVRGPDGQWVKKTRIAYVELDGASVELADRPDGEMRALEGRRVIADGTLVRPAPPPSDSDASQPSSPLTLAEVTSVKAVHEQ